ncbi:hypothetical protein DMC25_09055 [Caulobacter sp. D4A]|uniref:hypothetical protein n=1 Tax=unclassified Caulobacter TaxID=2648921 RepID=UPI000D73ACF6|nr:MULTISPECIES: hypothetical protein [unclassified Caulobacter]PXA85855.1 hypothetical protein DMC18_22600 [Caulobacter sp. D5]PXA89722.1 hypothetical protein DMC25_09055 [Caulobacter sp. D4A]
MQTDLETIKGRVVEATKAAQGHLAIDDVVIEAARNDDGSDFLRVVVQIKHSDKTEDRDLEALLEAIEDAVSAVDERYPSVRFADAA